MRIVSLVGLTIPLAAARMSHTANLDVNDAESTPRIVAVREKGGSGSDSYRFLPRITSLSGAPIYPFQPSKKLSNPVDDKNFSSDIRFFFELDTATAPFQRKIASFVLDLARFQRSSFPCPVDFE